MLPAGDTTSHSVVNWAHNQAAYIGGGQLLLLLVLTHHAFVKTNNPENAPVGQVMQAYSSIAALQAWSGLSRATVKRTLWSLQCEHGYLRRIPRTADGQPGTAPSIIRLYWTGEDDAMRASFRAKRSALPEEFDLTPEPVLRLVRPHDDEGLMVNPSGGSW